MRFYLAEIVVAVHSLHCLGYIHRYCLHVYTLPKNCYSAVLASSKPKPVVTKRLLLIQSSFEYENPDLNARKTTKAPPQIELILCCIKHPYSLRLSPIPLMCAFQLPYI